MKALPRAQMLLNVVIGPVAAAVVQMQAEGVSASLARDIRESALKARALVIEFSEDLPEDNLNLQPYQEAAAKLAAVATLAAECAQPAFMDIDRAELGNAIAWMCPRVEEVTLYS